MSDNPVAFTSLQFASCIVATSAVLLVHTLSWMQD